jgi:hypothetical protein
LDLALMAFQVAWTWSGTTRPYRLVDSWVVGTVAEPG